MDWAANIVRSLTMGVIVLCLLLWVLAENAISSIFLEKDVPARFLSVEEVEWEQRDYATGGDQEFTVTVEYRNLSELRIIQIDSAYRLLDCARRQRCSNVIQVNRSNTLDTPARMRGRFVLSFVVPRMATPTGDLILSVTPYKIDGVDD